MPHDADRTGMRGALCQPAERWEKGQTREGASSSCSSTTQQGVIGPLQPSACMTQGFKAGGARRLAIEIPVADESPASVRMSLQGPHGFPTQCCTLCSM